MRALRYLATLSLTAVFALAACTAGPPALQPADGTIWQSASPADEAALRALFDSTAAGWNRGDLATYLSVYADSATGNGAAGFDQSRSDIERTMRAGFWRNGRPAQTLHYEQLAIRMLGSDYALVRGKFILSGGDRPERIGLFSTVWARTSDGWRMINDHSG